MTDPAARGPAAVEILAIGNELLAGDILDTNFQALARALRDVGAEVTRHLTLPDERDVIAIQVREAAARAGAVIVTGGLGPTPDDLTRFGVADGVGAALIRDEGALETIRERFRKYGVGNMPVSNEVQAMFPEGATILDNPNGSAAGFRIDSPGGAIVFVLPGPPRELIPMIAVHLVPWFASRAGTAVIGTRRIRSIGIGESALAEKIADWPFGLTDIDLGYYPQDPGVDLKLTARGRTPEAVAATLDAAEKALFVHLGLYIYSVEPTGEARTPLAEVIGRRLLARGERLATAESCTGGLAAAMVTAIPGSSNWFDGGVVAYDNRVKIDTLRVSNDLITAHGAVSEEVARAMADGIRARFGTTWGIGITGLAGPTGGTDEKPVGLVWIAIAGPDGTTVQRTQHAGDRT
ncbi:MAG TPA: CinA family nicotinamide mononucleotide deamidase-related protein, partial [Candidatus Eisenbacteria bacterium]